MSTGGPTAPEGNPRGTKFLPIKLVVLGLVAAGIVGCTHKEDEEPAAHPQVVKFEGKVSEPLVGHWVDDKGAGELTLEKSGGMTVLAKSFGPGGPSTATKNGLWLVNGDKLLMKYGNGDGTEAIVAYGLKQSGKTMVLSTKVPKIETHYTRK